MGDASLPLSQATLQEDGTPIVSESSNNTLREVNILVTGFGSFKSFTTNPSYLIASNLARNLNPESTSTSVALKDTKETGQKPICEPDTRPFQVNVTVYPEPITVAYDVVRKLVPEIISDPEETSSVAKTPTQLPADWQKPKNGFDYILHIGLAAGRDNYTLETLAHRDHYKLKDVDDLDGSQGEATWREQGIPTVLHCGWNKEDVLARWEALVQQREDEYEYVEMVKAGWKQGSMTLVETARLRSMVFLGQGKRAAVKLSRDAGRYLCEFIYFTSLATRWRESKGKGKGKDKNKKGASDSTSAEEKVGKVAFLHVPGGTEKHDIARGVRVAESAILALAGSWEDGFRNPDVYAGEMQKSKGDDNKDATLYESKGTGDRVVYSNQPTTVGNSLAELTEKLQDMLRNRPSIRH